MPFKSVGIPGLLDIWIKPDKLCGAVLCFFPPAFNILNQVSSVVQENASTLFYCESPKKIFVDNETSSDSPSAWRGGEND